jgi:hydroxymethylbilane synthase
VTVRKEIIIGTRGSDLALWQANFVKSELEKNAFSPLIKIIKTKGDQIQHLSFDKMEGKGFFTKELEEALINNEIDLAVHSCKDLETTDSNGLLTAGFSYRENPSDLLVIKPNSLDKNEVLQLKKNAKVGTSSLRRKMQLKLLRPDLELFDLRGNVPTRFEKLKNSDLDAIMLATAGVNRLGIKPQDLIMYSINPQLFVPAPAQGVLAYQIRENDSFTKKAVESFAAEPDKIKDVLLERNLLKLLEGGCKMPIAIHCNKNNGKYNLKVVMAENAHSEIKSVELSQDSTNGMAKKALEILRKKKA